jgi:hypothetical protein
MECNAMSRSLAKLIGSMPDAAPAHGSMRAHMSTEEILDDIRLRIEWMPLECGPGVTIPALPPVDRHNPPKVKVYGGWKPKLAAGRWPPRAVVSFPFMSERVG